MRVAALGRTDRLYDSILEVARRGHEIVLVGTCPAAPDYTRTEEDFARLAADLGCPFFCNPRLARPERVAEIERSGAEIAISVNWPTLIPPSVLSLFEHGIINAHMGDLPRYRGNAAPNWAILAGESRVVLTLHEMSEALDAGPIVRQRAFALTPETYIGDVYRFATETVPILFGDVVDAAARGTLERRPQPADPGVSLRGLPRTPADGLMDWTRPAETLGRLVRASAEPFAGAFTFLNGGELVVWRAHPGPLLYPVLGVPGQVVEVTRDSGDVIVLTGDGVLVLEEVQRGSEPRCQPVELVTSTRTRLGLDLVRELRSLRASLARLERGAGSTGGPET